ncbi:hypothetical protein OC845_000730 [Tilletia horrida]|nr:hypothetical protein OC845_000730 [Tilletia horrida]
MSHGGEGEAVARLRIILNPASGVPGLSDKVYRSRVKPLLDTLSQDKSRTINVREYVTEREGDGVRIGQEIRAEIDAEKGASPTVYAILFGGDGTTHEFLNGFILEHGNSGKDSQSQADVRVQLAVVPTGTANALYAGLYPPGSSTESSSDEHEWRLRSVRALVNSLAGAPTDDRTAAPSTLVPLTLTSATLKVPDGSHPGSGERKMLAHIITSHALHAAILHDSEALRKEHPGIERFKIAAQKNATVWVDGSLQLRGAAAEEVTLYNPWQDQFIQVTEAKQRLQGPFLYIAALTTDRLEPTFVPGPFSTTAALSSAGSRSNPHPRPPGAIDLVVIRPTQSPAVQAAASALSEEHQFAWRSAETQPIRMEYALGPLTKITQLMYDEGKHAFLTYPSPDPQKEHASIKNEVLESSGAGNVVVEYYRCGAYTWSPAKEDERAQLTCVDGTIVRATQTDVEVLGSWTDKTGVWR